MRSNFYNPHKIKDKSRCKSCNFCDAYFISDNKILTRSEGVFCIKKGYCNNRYTYYELQKIKKDITKSIKKEHFVHLKQIKIKLKTKQELAKRHKIKIRDYMKLTKSCVICGFSEIVHLHHIIPKKDGGKDELENYVGLCPNHHQLIHLKNGKLTKDDGGYSIKFSKNKYKVFCKYLWKGVYSDFCENKNFWLVCENCEEYAKCLSRINELKQMDSFITT